MKRAVVSVATTPWYQKGMRRLYDTVAAQNIADLRCWRILPPESPTHYEKPYAFKPYALQAAADEGFETLLWADACMIPTQSMEPLWRKIEEDGAWISRNGWSNYEWTADSAYPALFPDDFTGPDFTGRDKAMGVARTRNATIPHAVATCFGISLQHPLGLSILHEYFRIAKDTNAFCGPWINASHPDRPLDCQSPRCEPCGPADVRGHRHDQTVLSVLAHRFNVELTDPPAWFAYKGGETKDTIMCADGGY